MNRKVNSLSLIIDASHLIKQSVRKKAEKKGYNSSYHPIFSMLVRNGKLTQQEMVTISRFKAPTICLLIRKMKQEGLVKSEMDLTDGRKTIISLTPKGEQKASVLMQVIEQYETKILENFKIEEQKSMTVLLNKLIFLVEEESLCSNDK